MRLPWSGRDGGTGGRAGGGAPWRGGDFVALLLAQAAALQKGVDEWTRFLADGDVRRLETIGEIEEEGDRARLAVVRALDERFITPIDREDLYALARAVDGVLDAVEMAMLECGERHIDYGAVAAVVSILAAAAVHVAVAVRALLSAPDTVRDESVEIHRAAKRIDRAAREGLHALGDDESVEGLRRVVRAQEINHYLRALGDRLDTLADVLAEIVVKAG